MKYQFKLVVLASVSKDKYVKRLKQFIYRYGFKFTNKSDINIKIVFLAQNEAAPDFISDNPLFEWIDVKEQLSTRFIRYVKDSPIDYEWLMQVDDDSSTDIDRSYEILSDFYDYADPIMFLCSRTADMDKSQQNILREMQIRNIFFGNPDINVCNGIPYFIHSWEASVISCGAAIKIKNNPKTKEYLKLSQIYRPGYGDNTPAVVAKICKVPVVEALFMSAYADMDDYSAINDRGRLTHIHYVLEDWEGYDNFIKKMDDNRSKIFKTDYADIDVLDDNVWVFGRIEDQRPIPYAHISLLEDGTIGNYDCYNEKFWEIRDDQIIFKNNIKEITTIFKKVNKDKYIGRFLLDKNVKHFLAKRLENDYLRRH